MKKIYTNNEFTGHWPVGTAAVVIADNSWKAAVLLNEELEKRNLRPTANEKDMKEFQMDCDKVLILCDGNY
jgi:hypothetical protein